MEISLEEFNKLPSYKRLHDQYMEKINKIGKELGFDTNGLKTPIGRLDAVWRIKNLNLPGIKENIPIVAFEIVCSEEQKGLKGSMSNLISSRPSLAVFCLLREGIKKSKNDKNPEKWLKKIENFVQRMKNEFNGIVRIAVWYEEDIDRLYKEIVKTK